jgi:hypothetical protein
MVETINSVIPAQAGIQVGMPRPPMKNWIPAFAGMTRWAGVVFVSKIFVSCAKASRYFGQ